MEKVEAVLKVTRAVIDRAAQDVGDLFAIAGVVGVIFAYKTIITHEFQVGVKNPGSRYETVFNQENQEVVMNEMYRDQVANSRGR